MYVPELNAILKKIGISKAEYDRTRADPNGNVSVPVALFEFLLQIALAQAEFNEMGYMTANPDVAEAHASGQISNLRLHYLGNGYCEGRSGAAPAVDERWYLRTYPDVSAAVRARHVASATQHFQEVGALELRAPSEKYVVDAVQWGRVFKAD